MNPPRPESQRARTARIARILERTLGIPVQEMPLPKPLDILVATILSQNTNDKNSHRAYTALRSRYRTWKKVAGADVKDLVSTIRSGGMANQKAPRIRNVVREVFRRHGRYNLVTLGGRTNDQIIEELTSLDGVGAKTAACVLLFSLGRDVFPVDTHVHRVCSRLGLTPETRTPEKTFEAMKHLVPRGKGYSFHTNLIRFGRRICKSNKPSCGVCPLFDDCVYPGKRKTAQSRQSSSVDHDFMLLDNVHRQRRNGKRGQ